MNEIVGTIEGPLTYGSRMESTQILHEWITAKGLNPYNSQFQNDEPQGAFLMIGNGHELEGHNDVEPYTIDNGTLFEDFVLKLLNGNTEWSDKLWVEKTTKMAKVGSLINEPANQRLLGLALSTTSGVPLRYCIQNEVEPSVLYWNYYANQLEDRPTGSVKAEVVVVNVASSNPVLSVCRTICPLICRGVYIILVIEDDSIALPCLVLAEFINKAELGCTVFRANPARVNQISAIKNIELIVCGGLSTVLRFRNTALNLKLEFDGKKAIVAMETGDCNAAVDSALSFLKSSGRSSPGLYFFIQDSMLQEVVGLLRCRFNKSQVGDLLNASTDFTNDLKFQSPNRVLEFIQRFPLEVIEMGNARVIFNAQPSLPLTQWDTLGQTLLVTSFRTVPELLSLIGNLKGLNELSLWIEQTSNAWAVTSQAQVSRIWVNGCGHYEPGCDQLRTVQHILERSFSRPIFTSEEGKTNSGLYRVLDGLLTAQRGWASQGNNRTLNLKKFLKHIMGKDPFFSMKAEVIMKLIKKFNYSRGDVVESLVKNSLAFDIAEPLGLVAIVDIDDRLDMLLSFITLALFKGNAVILCTSAGLDSSANNLISAAKTAGLSDVISLISFDDANGRALLKHQGVSKIVLIGPATLPLVAQPFSKGIWQSNKADLDDIIRHLTRRKWMWTAVGDGLANW